MRGYGFKAADADPCLYVKGSEENDDILIVVIWVDDLIITGSNVKTVADFKRAISRRFKMKDLGALRWILGMEIRRDRPNRRIEISQEAYI